MNLEDHAGDVVRKARQMAGLDVAEVAKRLGWEKAALERFEDSGQAPGTAGFASVAAPLGLVADCLARMCSGWTPREPETAAWSALRRFTTSGRGMSVHAYLVWDPDTREAALFDTGMDAAEPIRFMVERGLNLRQLCITHSHWDHIEGLATLRARFPEAPLRSNAMGAPAGVRVTTGMRFGCGRLTIEARETPGHAVDGVTYVVDGFGAGVPSLAVVGDAIFSCSMGGAREHGALARRAVREQILSLPPATLLCPGHGPFTTVAAELVQNPFFALPR